MKEDIYLFGHFFNKDNQDEVCTYKIFYKKDPFCHMDYSIKYTIGDIFSGDINWLSDAPAESIYSAIKRVLVRFSSKERAVNGLYRDMPIPTFTMNRLFNEINNGVRLISIEGDRGKYANLIYREVENQYVVQFRNLFT